MTAWMKRPASGAMAVLAIAVVCALLLVLPGQTVTTKYLNDLFIFLDGVHRIAAGQVPNLDFHTALGPLVYYVPAIGYWLSGSFGGAMPFGMALLVVGMAPAAAHVLTSRMRPAIALPLAAFLFLIAAVPINPGESIGSLSFAMFYNRIGWTALGFLLVMYLRPAHPRRHQAVLDAACAAFLILLMLYMKISYGVVGLGFLVLMLLVPLQRRWAAAAFALVIAAGLTVEWLWGGTAAHIGDLILAGHVSGRVSSIVTLAEAVFKNFADYVLFTLFITLSLWRTRSFRDLLFFGFCAGSGLLLIIQNFQNWGIFTLPVGAAVAAEITARADGPAAERQRRSLTAGAQLLLLAFMLPAGVHHAAALALHAGLATLEKGQPVPLANFKDVRLVQLWTEGDYPVFTRYLESLQEGARALESLERETGKVLVLDFVGPFSAGLGLSPPQGDSTWHHWGRTINEENHLPAEELFRTVEVVMDPKWPIESWTADGLRLLYADHLAEHFMLAQETKDWRIYIRRPGLSEHLSRSLQPWPGSFDPQSEETVGDLQGSQETLVE